MGHAKEFKKLKKQANKLIQASYQDFRDNFDLNEYVRECPSFVPKFIWNKLVNFMVKKKIR